MKPRLIIVLAVCVLVAMWSLAAVAQDTAKKVAPKKEKAPEYVGEKKCKTCHKTQHASWLETAHAKAYDVLKPEDKKKDSCVVCHVTGFGVADTLFEGVQCEACHGPGSKYKSAKIMSKAKYKKDRETQHKLAVEAGLIIPDEKVCVGCHNKKSPTFKGFDFEKYKVKGVHPAVEAPAKETKKEDTAKG